MTTDDVIILAGLVLVVEEDVFDVELLALCCPANISVEAGALIVLTEASPLGCYGK